MGEVIRAAGGVVYREKDGVRRFLVAHRPRYDDWTLPKGKADDGERLRAAAIREVREETGVRGRPEINLGTIAYTPSDRWKLVRYWVMSTRGGKFNPNEEVDQIKWLPLHKALARLDHPRDREVLAWAADLLADPLRSRILLVRHAYAGKRGRWKGPDEERPVMGVGKAQVDFITEELSGFPVRRIISSPYVRCVQTVEPIAGVLGLGLQRHPGLAEGAAPKDTMRLLRGSVGRCVVACTHGDVITTILERAATKKVEGADPQRLAKGSIWVIDLHEGRMRSARYIPPEPVDAGK